MNAAWNLNYRTNNTTTYTFKVNTKNDLTNATPVGTQVYDGNGNVTSSQSGSETFTYDDENRLASAQVNASWKTDFVYDGLGRLRSRSEYTWLGGWYPSTPVNYIYDGMRVIQERVSSPSVSYTRGSDLSGSLEGAGGIGGLLARSHAYQSGGGNFTNHNYYHADGNGNITYLVTGSQTLAASYRHDPFGNTISSSGTLASANVYRFSSKEIHVNSGLYYYGYRWYSPNLQRWLNRDPLGELGFETIVREPARQPENPNRYLFVRNQPVNVIDLYGLRVEGGRGSGGGPEMPPPPPLAPEDQWDDGYTDCWIRCMLGLPTAADVASHMGLAEQAAGTYYHFTDGRFTAWGRSSRVLVPRAAGKINLVGALVSLCEALHCMDKCLKETSGADPSPPPPPYTPAYPPSWPGRGHNTPPILQ